MKKSYMLISLFFYLFFKKSTPREEMLPKAVQLAKDLVATIKTEVEKQPQNMGYNRGYHNYQVSIYLYIVDQ